MLQVNGDMIDLATWDPGQTAIVNVLKIHGEHQIHVPLGSCVAWLVGTWIYTTYSDKVC